MLQATPARTGVGNELKGRIRPNRQVNEPPAAGEVRIERYDH